MNLDDQADQDAALRVRCPDRPYGCGVAIGVLCVRGDGRPLEHVPAHIHRLHAAGVAHAPLDPRELRGDYDRRVRW